MYYIIPYEIATISNRSTTNYIEKYNSLLDFDSNAVITRTDSFDDFNYLKNENKVIVWNSQQLWYALEKDYVPIPVENSPAELVLNAAKDILRKIIKNDMSDEEKIFRIFEWMSNNVQYDHQAYNYNNSSNMDLYPDENYSRLKSMHVEGGIFDGLCVGAGYAKTYLLFLKIEGIEAIKILARANGLAGKNTINSRDYGGGGFGFHEFVYIKMNNQWYYSDAERSCLENNNVIHSIVYLMLSPNSQDYGFTVMDSNCDKSMVKYENIYKKIKFDNLSIYDEIESKIKKFPV